MRTTVRAGRRTVSRFEVGADWVRSGYSWGRSVTKSKRELIEPHKGDKRYVRRDDKGRYKVSAPA